LKLVFCPIIRGSIQQLKNNGIDLTKEYDDWVKLGFAFASLGEQGRTLFHELSELYSEYDYKECDNKFDELAGKTTGTSTIATFFQYCSEAGVYYIDKQEERQSTAATAIESPTLLQIILDSEQKLRERMKEKISFVQPIIKHDENDLFYPNSLNVIQGKMGSHKSRFVGDVASLLLHKDITPRISGMSRVALYNRPLVCYIDTERNHKDQFPYAMQQIKLRAGYTLEDELLKFRFNSFIDVPRKDRQQALKQLVEHMRLITEDHLVFIIDVMTDLLEDFNQVTETYEFIDYLNVLINQYEITFFLVIHENPNNDKGRGHTGTEGGNKASSLVQVAREQGTDIIKINPKKIRNGSCNWDYNLMWSDEEKGLVEASGEDVAMAKAAKSTADAPLSEVLDLTVKVLLDGGPLNKGNLIDDVISEFEKAEIEVSKRTLQRRFDVVPGSTVQYGEATYKIVMKEDGKEKIFSLENATIDNKEESDLPF